MDLIVHQNPECVERGINPFDHGSALHTDMWKTEGLKQVIDHVQVRSLLRWAPGATRRSRGPRSGSSRSDRPSTSGTPSVSGPSCGRSTTGAAARARPCGCSRSRTGPSSTCGSTSTSSRSRSCRCTSRSPRPVVDRDGMLIMVDDDRFRSNEGEVPEMKSVRFRTLGCYPLSGAIESDADTLTGVIQEMLLATTSERQGRVIDFDGAGVDGEEEARRVFLMAHSSELIATDIEEYLRSHQYKSLLRFITCGSVDDGKSTLIGRLLYESHLVFEDHLAALEADSAKVGTQGDDLDFALLLDGLTAEREQGITIDVAYRFFSTEQRKFIVADTPGHEQYTRNMVTGRLDRRRRRDPGRRSQGRADPDPAPQLPRVAARHQARRRRRSTRWTSSTTRSERFEEIEAEYRSSPRQIGLDHITFIPMSALKGDNVTERERHTRPGTTVPTLIELPRDRAGRRRARRAARSACPCSGSTVRTSTSVASPARSSAARSGRATRSASCRPARPARSTASSRWTVTSTRRSPVSRSRSRSPTRSTHHAAT